MTKRRWVALLAVAVLASASVTVAVASDGSITGFPNKINTLNLDGYQFTTSYPLGFDAGNTFKQTYGTTTASYVTLKGTIASGSGFPYVTLPIAHKIFMVVWLFSDGTHNSFVYNLNNDQVSVVTSGMEGPPSLGSVRVVRVGANPIP